MIMARGVDEFVVALRPQRAWSTLVAWDLFLTGTGAGLFLVAYALTGGNMDGRLFTLSRWLGLGLVCSGALVLLADLGVPSRFLRVLSRPGSSWVSRGAWTMLLFSLFAFLSLLPTLPGLGSLPWSGSTSVGTFLAAVTLLLAFALVTYTGLLLSSWNAIPFWNTPLLPVLFIISCLLGATGAVLALAVVLGVPTASISQVAIILLLAVSFSLLLYLLVMRDGTAAARESVRLLLSGPETGTFLRGVVVIGLLAPLVLLVASLAVSAAAAALSIVAGILILVGTFELRNAVLKVGVFNA